MTDTTPAPVRVPNVSPGARSGLDHQVIGENAILAHQANLELNTTDADETINARLARAAAVTVPAGDEASRVVWVGEAETLEDRIARADAVFQHATDTGADHEELETLAAGLRAAVDPDEDDTQDDTQDEFPEVPEELHTVDQLVEWVEKAEDSETQKARAVEVLRLEAEQDKPRTSLTDRLAKHIAD